METYKRMKKRHQAEVDALPFFFSGFMGSDNSDVLEKCEAAGIRAYFDDDGYLREAPHSYEHMATIGGGMICTLHDFPHIMMAFDRQQDELKVMMTHSDFAIDAFFSEMLNHEYSIAWDGPEDVCRALGYSVEDVQQDARLFSCYKAAEKKYYACDLF